MKNFKSQKFQFVLASGSPRRKELLQSVGIYFQKVSPRVDEGVRPKELPKALVKRLSFEKASEVMNRVSTRASFENKKLFVLGADTIVFLSDSNRILGKPKNRVDAVRMLKMLSNRAHWVYTGYTLIYRDSSGKVKRKTRGIGTRVRFRPLSLSEIQEYIRSGEPMDKAGSYAAQGKGMTLIQSISGSYTNVVGLPVAEVLKDISIFLGKR